MSLILFVGTPIRVNIRSDSGTYTGTLLSQPWELLLPWSISVKDFESHRTRMGGFNEASKSVALSVLHLTPDNAERVLYHKLQTLLNVYTVQGPGVGEMLFAGALRQAGMEQRALISMTTKRYVVVVVVVAVAVVALTVNMDR